MGITQSERNYDAAYVIVLDGEVMQDRSGRLWIFTNLEDAKKSIIDHLELGMNVEIEKYDLNFQPLDFNEEERADLEEAEIIFRIARRLYKSRMNEHNGRNC